MKRLLSLALLLAVCASLLCLGASGANELWIDDRADLLTDGQEAALRSEFAELTDYVSAAFLSVDVNPSSAAAFAERTAIERYGESPAVLFLIDMANRELYVYANGAALYTVSRADARAVTDNVYRIASRGDYYECARQVFSQLLGKYRGAALARPVKHVTNALIALLFGVLANYLVAAASRRESAPQASVRTMSSPELLCSAPTLLRSRRIEHDTGGGGHSGGGRSGGGFSGGGFSGGHSGGHVGGGGGHKF